MKVTKKTLIQSIRNNGGFVTRVAAELGISVTAVYKRMNKHPDVKAVLEEVREQYIDLAENALIRRVREGDLGAICFYLKCQAKHRGYIEKVSGDFTVRPGEGEKPFKVEVVAGCVEDDEEG